MPQEQGEAQPGHLDPGGELAPCVVLWAQNVSVPLYGVQNAFKTNAIPVTRNFAAQIVELIQVALALAKVFPRNSYLVAHPSAEWGAVRIIGAGALRFQEFTGDVDETIRDILQHISQHVRHMSRGSCQITVFRGWIGLAVPNEVLNAVCDGLTKTARVPCQLILADESPFALGVEL